MIKCARQTRGVRGLEVALLVVAPALGATKVTNYIGGGARQKTIPRICFLPGANRRWGGIVYRRAVRAGCGD